VAELDIQGILEQLSESGVEHIVIGGVAVGFHGYVRATKDLDVVPAPDLPNLERLAKALHTLEAELDGAGDLEAPERPDPLDPAALAQGGNWVLQTRLGRFDRRMPGRGAEDMRPLLRARVQPGAITV
jgi:hypothetical protein